MFESTPRIRWFHDPCFWIAFCGSVTLNAIGLVGFFFIVLELRVVTETQAILLQGYGDSDHAGFPIDVVSLDPGAYRQGPQNTPGGDNAPFPPAGEALPPPSDSPLSPPEPKKEPEPAPKPNIEEPAPKKEVVEDVPSPAPTPASAEKPSGTAASIDSKSSSADKGTTTALPGAAGGANMKIGTPSAGGTVGSRTGVGLPYNTPKPPYPAEARARLWEGTPVVVVSISADGHVTEAKIHKKCNYPLLDKAAVDWVKTLRFIPPTVNSVPVPTTFYHDVKFRLTDK
jgi:periplasmic protein TonB